MRSAESRLGVIDSLGSARLGVERTYARLSAPRAYFKAGMWTGGGVLGMLALRRVIGWLRSKPVAVTAVATGRSLSSPVPALLVQALTVLVFPWLRDRLLKNDRTGSDALKKWNPSRIFFRWLGLD